MTHTEPHARTSDEMSELASVFGRQVFAINRRLKTLRGVDNRVVAFERRCLLEQKGAWRFGIVTLLRQGTRGPATIVELLNDQARRGEPRGEVLAVMAAMVAIRALWSSAHHAAEGHPARGGLDD